MLTQSSRVLVQNGYRVFYRPITSLHSIEGFRSNVGKHKQATEDKRNLILSILQSTSGKREARDYLKKYSLLKNIDDNNKQVKYDEPLPITASGKTKYDKIIDNLIEGEGQPGKVPSIVNKDKDLDLSDTLRVAILKIRDFESLTKETMNGIGLTIYSMIRLGISPIIVVDNDDEMIKNSTALKPSFSQLTHKIIEQSNNMMDAIHHSTKGKNNEIESRSVRGVFEIGSNGLELTLPESLLIPLSQGVIPIIYPIAYNLNTSSQDLLTSTQVLNCLVDDMSKLNNSNDEELLTIEKIIFIDPEGGIPSIERFKSSHVLINLLQEYEDIQSELHIGFLKPAVRDLHLQNLQLMNELLDKLPNSTGIITTPEIATLADKTRYTNPIIYNILTDRAVISSSLPVNLTKTPQLNTTVIKKGIPIKILEDSRGLSLINNPEIDLDKFKTLIDDSFKRNLDLTDYLKRINNHVLAIIIAGDYEGAAIVTGESQGVPYLDKFAVSTKSQGSSGVADIVFKSLLNQFPERLIWRSRKNNPVNKWYFERSNFNVSIPDSNWKLFYSGSQKLTLSSVENYVAICQSINPSWQT